MHLYYHDFFFSGMHLYFQVKADVTEGATKLAEVISHDSDAVICATGFRPSWDLTAPWKVSEFLQFLCS